MDSDHIIDGLVDELASIEHARWAKWQRYLHDTALRQQDGSLVIPAELVERWERQIKTPYQSLTKEEQESDREQVLEYLPVIKDALRAKLTKG